MATVAQIPIHSTSLEPRRNIGSWKKKRDGSYENPPAVIFGFKYVISKRKIVKFLELCKLSQEYIQKVGPETKIYLSLDKIKDWTHKTVSPLLSSMIAQVMSAIISQDGTKSIFEYWWQSDHMPKDIRAKIKEVYGK